MKVVVTTADVLSDEDIARLKPSAIIYKPFLSSELEKKLKEVLGLK